MVPERFKDNILQRMDADEAASQRRGEETEVYGRDAAVSLKR